MRYTQQKQGTPEWYALRLGRITSTTAAALMTKGRKAGELSNTAKSELYRIKAERNLRKEFRTSRIDEYIERTGFHTAAIDFGKQTEDEARQFYTLNTGNIVTEIAFITPENEDLEDYWGDSPDGIVFDDDRRLVGCIEIKCPKPATFMEYATRFSEGETLKQIEPKYWWQVCNHLAVSGADWCDFIIYDPMQKNGYRCVREDAKDPETAADIKALTETITSVITNHLKTK